MIYDFKKQTNETQFSLLKYISHTLFAKRAHILLRKMKIHILRERTSSHIFFREPGGANAFTPLQASQRRPDRLRVPRSDSLHTV